MIYTIDVVKEVVQTTVIEGNTLREALQRIADDRFDDDIEWVWDTPEDEDVDHVILSMIIGVSHEGITTKKQEHEAQGGEEDLEGNRLERIRGPDGPLSFFVFTTIYSLGSSAD